MADQQSTPEPPEPGPSSKPEPRRKPEPMTRERAIELLKTDVPAWNKWRDENPDEELPDLKKADLSIAHLEEANLRGAHLEVAQLDSARLQGAKLSEAHLEGADLWAAHLEGANLMDANLNGANLTDANLSDANLSGAHLICADLTDANLDSVDLSRAEAFVTTFANLDLTNVRGLESIKHVGPSTVGTDTLVRSRGRIPEVFLRGCGLQPWEVEAAKLYAPGLTPEQVNDIQYRIFALRTGPMFLGRIFISYSHDDKEFADKLYDRLTKEGANVWTADRDAVAGRLQDQVDRTIRLNDFVVLVLSKASVHSDWVKHELKMARKKEQKEGRDVLCPVRLDDAWHAKKDDLLWERLTESLIVDFSKWKTKAFEAPFQKLIKGLRTNFPRPNADPSGSAPKADG